MNQEDFFNIFRTDRAQMEQAVSAGLSSGGDWCDLYFEYTIYNDLLLKDGEVNDGSYNEDFGVGIRVLDGEKTGYAYSESTGLKDMLAAARAASSIAGGRGRQERIPAIETGRGRTGRSSVMEKGIRPDGIGNPDMDTPARRCPRRKAPQSFGGALPHGKRAGAAKWPR